MPVVINGSTGITSPGGDTSAADNTINGVRVGEGAGSIATNTALGASALNANTTGSNNTAVGSSALVTNTTGANNTAVGRQALNDSTTASDNTAIGFQANAANTTGASNTSVGNQALRFNTTASNNTAVGYQAGYTNSTGVGNSALGYQALYLNTTGSYSTAVGFNAGTSNTTGTITAVGTNALRSNTTGNANTAVGGYDTVSTADGALFSNTTGSYNIAVGTSALRNNTTGSNNTAQGFQALNANTTASNNTAVGYQAGYSQTTVIRNTLIGGSAGYSTTGGTNTFVGESAGYAVTSGTNNTIIGRYDGNQGGLDIRTASNNIVLSDGAGNPRVWVDSNNYFYFAGLNQFPGVGNTNNGFMIESTGSTYTSRSAGYPVAINRNSDDGTLVRLAQAGTEEGNISVSGTTVSFNGGHLSRWSQLPDGSKDESIVKGTVMSNLDDMCVWEKGGVVADNEQLNKMKVSDVEGDTNVAGVFVNWTMDEEYGVDDMNVAMTGDMIIRIAQSVVVQKGDLLMSAGDGTAKPQGDDIRRSKTVAKVTSNHVTCTYADGSYCVPCVLMAC